MSPNEVMNKNTTLIGNMLNHIPGDDDTIILKYYIGELVALKAVYNTSIHAIIHGLNDTALKDVLFKVTEYTFIRHGYDFTISYTVSSILIFVNNDDNAKAVARDIEAEMNHIYGNYKLYSLREKLFEKLSSLITFVTRVDNIF